MWYTYIWSSAYETLNSKWYAISNLLISSKLVILDRFPGVKIHPNLILKLKDDMQPYIRWYKAMLFQPFCNTFYIACKYGITYFQTLLTMHAVKCNRLVQASIEDRSQQMDKQVILTENDHVTRIFHFHYSKL